MATIDAQSGKIIPASDSGGGDPYSIFADNMTSMLKGAQKVGQQGNANFGAQKDALARGGVALGTPGVNNPLNFLYNMSSSGDLANNESSMSDIFKPAITSIQTQEQLANENLTNINNAADTMINASKSQIGRYSTGQIPGTLQMYTYDSATGKYTDQYGNPLTPPTGTKPPAPHPLVNGTDWSSYNGRMDPDYETKMSNSISTLQEAMPQGFTQTGADGTSIADGILKTNKSPLNSSMFGLAAKQYGIDPISLMASVQHESVWGTSNVAKEDNNFGGIKWANQPNATMGSLSPEGDHYAKFNTAQDGLYAQAKLIAQYTQGNQLSTSNTNSSTSPTSSANSGDPVTSVAQQVISGAITPEYAATLVANIPSGQLALNQKIQELKPGFNTVNASGSSAATKTNTETAETIKPTIQSANDIMDGTNGVESITDIYDKLPSLMMQGGDLANRAARAISGSTGVGADEIKAYDRALSDLRTKANAVLNTAASLGVKTSGETADTLFPDNMTKAALLKSIKQVKSYEASMYSNLTNQGTTGSTLNPTSQAILDKYKIK